MKMSDFEIVRDYRHAKNKVEQVQILADMNLCSKEEIEDVLEQGGVMVLRADTPEEKRQSVFYLYHKGIDDEEIATLIGLKPSSVGQIRVKLGLKKHKKKKACKSRPSQIKYLGFRFTEHKS